MKKLLLNVVAAVVMIAGLGSVATMSPAYAKILCPGTSNYADTLEGCAGFENTDSGLNKNNLTTTINTIINVIIGVVGFVAVVMMIVGGISFITSQGDSAKVTKARNTILYGVVGLVVALLAFAIVNFVLGSVFGSGN